MHKLDYSVKHLLITNINLACTCQRCGEPSEGTLCKDCAPPKKAELPTRRMVVSLEGYNVLLNGAVVAKGANYLDALDKKKALSRRHARHNLYCHQNHVR